jgi:hypothetical protein
VHSSGGDEAWRIGVLRRHSGIHKPKVSNVDSDFGSSLQHLRSVHGTGYLLEMTFSSPTMLREAKEVSTVK